MIGQVRIVNVIPLRHRLGHWQVTVFLDAGAIGVATGGVELMAVWWRRAVPALVLATCGAALAGCRSTDHKATGTSATQGNSSIASSSGPPMSSGSKPPQKTKPN